MASGVATSYLQGVLPGRANFLANSGAAWVLIAFLLARTAANRPRAAAAAGALGLLGEVLGYYAIASPLRHIATSEGSRLLWTAAALLIGPFVGLLAFQSRCGQPHRRLIAVTAISGVVAGEGAYATLTLGYPVQGWVEIAVAAASILAAVLRVRVASRYAQAAAIAVSALVATVVFGAYHL
jgi:hypothetical protein